MMKERIWVEWLFCPVSLPISLPWNGWMDVTRPYTIINFGSNLTQLKVDTHLLCTLGQVGGWGPATCLELAGLGNNGFLRHNMYNAETGTYLEVPIYSKDVAVKTSTYHYIKERLTCI